MPYLDAEDRRNANLHSVGKLTYDIQQLLMQYLEEAAGLGCKPEYQRDVRYADLAECLGAIEGARLDFIDRVVLPYERKKRYANGDVWHPAIMEALGIGSGPHSHGATT